MTENMANDGTGGGRTGRMRLHRCVDSYMRGDNDTLRTAELTGGI